MTDGEGVALNERTVIKNLGEGELYKCLRACPPEDQAGVIHAISPISVKLGQMKGHTVLQLQFSGGC